MNVPQKGNRLGHVEASSSRMLQTRPDTYLKSVLETLLGVVLFTLAREDALLQCDLANLDCSGDSPKSCTQVQHIYQASKALRDTYCRLRRVCKSWKSIVDHQVDTICLNTVEATENKDMFETFRSLRCLMVADCLNFFPEVDPVTLFWPDCFPVNSLARVGTLPHLQVLKSPSCTPTRRLVESNPQLQRLCLSRGSHIVDWQVLPHLNHLTHLILSDCTPCLAREVMRKLGSSWPCLRVFALEVEGASTCVPLSCFKGPQGRTHPTSSSHVTYSERLLGTDSGQRFFSFSDAEDSLVQLSWQQVAAFRPSVLEVHSSRAETFEGLKDSLHMLNRVTSLALAGPLLEMLKDLRSCGTLGTLKAWVFTPSQKGYVVNTAWLPPQLTSLTLKAHQHHVHLDLSHMTDLTELRIMQPVGGYRLWRDLRRLTALQCLELQLGPPQWEPPTPQELQWPLVHLPQEVTRLTGLRRLQLVAGPQGSHMLSDASWSTLCTLTSLTSLDLEGIQPPEQACPLSPMTGLRALRLPAAMGTINPDLLQGLRALQILLVPDTEVHLDMSEREPSLRQGRHWHLKLAGLDALRHLHVGGQDLSSSLSLTSTQEAQEAQPVPHETVMSVVDLLGSQSYLSDFADLMD